MSKPPTLDERLDWTYEQLLQLRVSMRHLAKQVSGPTGQIEEWRRQLTDMVDGVTRMQGVRHREEEAPETVPGLVGEVEKGPLRMPEPFPGTEGK